MERPQRLARNAERLTAERHGGQVTPQSGSGRTVKNDVRNETWSFEVKSTSRKSYSLTREALAKATRHALEDGRKMAFLVAFVGSLGGPPKRYVLIEEDDFIELTERQEP